MPRTSRRKFLRDTALSGVLLSQRSRFAFASVSRPQHSSVDWSQYKLFFNRPAPSWPDALPVGNGRLGAMVFGNPVIERIQLNEDSIWDGERRNRDNPRAAAAVPEIRRLLFAGKVHEAEQMAVDDMLSIPRRMPCYQTLGDLYIDFSPSGLPAGNGSNNGVADYRLELDLDRAVVTTTFTHAGVLYTREVFSSAPDQVVVIRLTASKPGRLSFNVRFDRPGNHTSGVAAKDTLVLSGEALPVDDNPGLPVKERQTGVRFLAHLRAVTRDGEVQAVAAADNQPAHLGITGATAVTLLVDCATSFRHPAGDQAMAAAVERNLISASRRSYSSLRARHIADHRGIFRRAALELGPSETLDPNAHLATNVRMSRIKNGAEDLGLLPIYFQFGRYMLISSSRPGTLAANLQGIWNDSVNPPWGSKYTVNINAEMNYWIADRTNLADIHGPFFDLIDMTRGPGARVAKTYYNARGFVVHHNTDLWGDAGPIDGLGGGIWAMGAAWMTTQLWDHYLYSLDENFLRDRAYPRLREVALFLLDYLTPSPDGYLVTGPSCSPENSYILPDGTRAHLCMGPTMDIAITRATFRNATKAAEILDVDPDLRAQMAHAASHLPPYRIGRYGQLQEWMVDYEEVEPGHRHISPLWGLYPDDQITLHETPKLAEACRATLNRRLSHGGGSTGWSRAWVINCFARLEDGDRCHEQLMELLRRSTRDNLFDVCGMKPTSYYQIDGNLGAPAGMAEMLLQSHSGIIRFLPALPFAWPDGYFTGLRTRGGLTVDLKWRNEKAEHAVLAATINADLTLAAPHGQQVTSKLPALTQSGEGLYRLRARRGQKYHLQFA